MLSIILTKLRLLRLERNYSQEYIASKLNISQSYYAKIESGKKELSVRSLFEILEILQMDSLDFHVNTKEYYEKLLEKKEIITSNTSYE